MDSILTSVKKLIGISEDDDQFDADIIIHINSVLVILSQLGVGNGERFTIEDDSATWDEFIPDSKILDTVKTYVYLRVKLIFDPPASSSVTESINRTIAELEWRINSEVDY